MAASNKLALYSSVPRNPAVLSRSESVMSTLAIALSIVIVSPGTPCNASRDDAAVSNTNIRLRRAPAGERCPHRHVFLAAAPRKQHLERCQQRHERRHALREAQRQQSPRELCTEHKLLRSTPIALHSRPRKIGRQLEDRRRPRQPLFPVRQLPVPFRTVPPFLRRSGTIIPRFKLEGFRQFKRLAVAQCSQVVFTLHRVTVPR